MPPAATISKMHVCPMVTGVVPHVGGPIIGPGAPTVLIGGLPAAVVGDSCVCTGPPDSIIKGSATVLIGGKPAARMGGRAPRKRRSSARFNSPRRHHRHRRSNRPHRRLKITYYSLIITHVKWQLIF